MKSKIAIITAPFYTHITDGLFSGALRVLEENKLTHERFDVAGALEIPLACQLLAQSGKYQAIVALGSVIRGETPHFDHVCEQSSRGLLDVSLKYNIPIGNGIITIENEAQALARSGDNKKNKGAEAVQAVIGLLELKEKL
jgi:6,7-dimethyl-8-ribityllumazine synthase